MEWDHEIMSDYKEKQYTGNKSGYQKRGKQLDKRTLSQNYLKGKSLSASNHHDLSIHTRALQERIAAIDLKLGNVKSTSPKKRKKKTKTRRQRQQQLFSGVSGVMSPIVLQSSQGPSGRHSPTRIEKERAAAAARELHQQQQQQIYEQEQRREAEQQALRQEQQGNTSIVCV